MVLSPIAMVLIGLLLAAWSAAAAWIALSARAGERQARGARATARRLTRMIDTAPALPLLVRADGRIEGPDRLAAWLGLERMPDYLSELGGEGGLSPDDLDALREAVRRAQKTAAPFALSVGWAGQGGARRSLALRGQRADPAIAPNAAALVWWFDFSESEAELVALREEAERATADFAALVGLIEVAPMPMWFRGPDLALRMVNRAYVEAVGADSAEDVLARQVELVEPVEGLAAAQVAGRALAGGAPVERIVQATLGNQRLALRVSDLPLGRVGVAGYAVDIEEQERRTRTLRAFRGAQRALLDQLSLGIAQFDRERRLAFANDPFRRIFKLPPAPDLESTDFDRVLDRMRDAGHLPETRDFPAWRRELGDWFTADEPVRVDWPLSDGVNLKVAGHPMPDGGLVLVAEDRTEQLALAATRDTLLRVRTAMIDSLLEGLAVFAPDGRTQLWNRRFPEIWSLPESLFDPPPRIDALVEEIGHGLARPTQRRAIGEAVRTATLERRQRGGQVQLADGRMLVFTAVPLPDGNGLLTVLDVTGGLPPPPLAEAPPPEPEEAPVEPETIDLLPFVTALAREREQVLEDRGQALDLRAARNAGSVTADLRRLTEAVGILLDTAIANAPQGTGRIAVHLAGPKKPRITFSDNGPGATTEQIPLALGGNGRQAAALSGELARARQLIESLGGRLDLQSGEGGTTTASVTLP